MPTGRESCLSWELDPAVPSAMPALLHWQIAAPGAVADRQVPPGIAVPKQFMCVEVPVVQKEGPDVLLGIQNLRDSLADKGVQEKGMCREGKRLGG